VQAELARIQYEVQAGRKEKVLREGLLVDITKSLHWFNGNEWLEFSYDEKKLNKTLVIFWTY
jgi:hypothetical protein